MGRRGEMGKCAVVTATEDGWLCGTGSLFVRPTKEVDPNFIATWLRSPIVRKRLDGESVGSTMNNLNLRILNNLVVGIPPLAEQKRIVAKVDQLMALCDDLEARQTKKRETGSRLTKSALEALTTAEGPEVFDAAWKRVVENFDVLIDRAEQVDDLRGAIRGSACGGWLSAHARRTDWGGGERDLAAISAERKHERRRLLRDGVRASSLPREERADFAPEAVPYGPASWALCGVDDILACVPNALKAGPFGSALTKSMYVPRGFKVYGQEQVIPA